MAQLKTAKECSSNRPIRKTVVAVATAKTSAQAGLIKKVLHCFA